MVVKGGIYINEIMKLLNGQGLWKIEDISVRVLENNLAWISYEKKIINAERHRITVRVGFFERRKGVTLEDKISETLIKLKKRLSIENEQIKKHKELESKFK